MKDQQYQGVYTDLMVSYVKQEIWTAEEFIESREKEKDRANRDQDWIDSIDETLSILQSQQQKEEADGRTV